MEEYGSNAIPSALIDQVSAKFQGFYPSSSSHIPNGHFVSGGGVGSHGEAINNFTASVPSTNPYNKYFGRFDYDITKNNRLTMSDTQADNPAHYPSSVAACPVACQAGDVDNNNAQITDVWVHSPVELLRRSRIEQGIRGSDRLAVCESGRFSGGQIR
jgi:hypothetical protein